MRAGAVQLVTENIAFPRAIQLDPTGTWLYAKATFALKFAGRILPTDR